MTNPFTKRPPAPATDPGELVVPPETPPVERPKRRRGRPRSEGLTPRQTEIVDLLCEGLTAVQVGERLGMKADTVRTHISNALLRTHTHTRAQLVYQVKGKEIAGS